MLGKKKSILLSVISWISIRVILSLLFMPPYSFAILIKNKISSLFTAESSSASSHSYGTCGARADRVAASRGRRWLSLSLGRIVPDVHHRRGRLLRRGTKQVAETEGMVWCYLFFKKMSFTFLDRSYRRVICSECSPFMDCWSELKYHWRNAKVYADLQHI